jgi:dihydrofolate synthase/folylpolyglutamate synthase
VPRFAEPLRTKKLFAKTTNQIRQLIFARPDRHRTIIITGTNGKGSVAAIASFLLATAGFTVGTISSPAVTSDCTDMIRVNGRPIDASQLLTQLQKAHVSLSALPLSRSTVTHYMLLCIAGFSHFHDSNVDVVVAETAIGGAYDPTVPLRPDICAFTTVAHDHLDVLGPTVEHISRHKSRIIGPGSLVLLGEQIPLVSEMIIRAYARQKRAAIVQRVARPLEDTHPGASFQYRAGPLTIRDNGGRCPPYQHPNLRLAASIFLAATAGATRNIDIDLASSDCRIFPPCRFEVRRRGPTTYVFDSAKNEHSYATLRESLARLYGRRQMSFLKGADSQASIDTFEKVFRPERVLYVSGYHPRVIHQPGFVSIDELDFDAIEHNFGTDLVVVCGMFLAPVVKERLFPSG